MSKEAPEWAQVGVEMLEVRGGLGRAVYGTKPVKIAARLKNGNIRLEGHDGQWRCWNGRASEAGERGYRSSSSYHLLTPELLAEADTERRVLIAKAGVRKEADRLENLWRHGDDETIIAAAAALKEPPQ